MAEVVDKTPSTDKNAGNDEVIVEGEIVTKPSSDDHPPYPDEDGDHPFMISATEDVYEAARVEIVRMKEGESTIGSLDEVIERCVAESQLQEYTSSLEAIKDLYDTIFEESFAAGVAWRERIGVSEAEKLADDMQKSHKELMKKFEDLTNKYQATKKNRDETKRLLDKEMEKKANAQKYVFALRITLKVIMEILLDRVSRKNKEIVVGEVHNALVTNKVIDEENSESIKKLLFPEAANKGCKKTDIPPLKRIDIFLKSVRTHIKGK